MDYSIVLFIVAVVAGVWLLLRFGLRRKQTETPKLQAAMGVIGSLNDNIRILEIHLNDRTSTKKFRTGDLTTWQYKLDFLDKTTQDAVKQTTALTLGFNTQIDEARKSHNPASLQEMPVEKLKEPLAKSKEGLVMWLKANLEIEMRKGTRKSMIGF
jgi:hypothetical protein